jgi:hypothetical protein
LPAWTALGLAISEPTSSRSSPSPSLRTPNLVGRATSRCHFMPTFQTH